MGLIGGIRVMVGSYDFRVRKNFEVNRSSENILRIGNFLESLSKILYQLKCGG